MGSGGASSEDWQIAAPLATWRSRTRPLPISTLRTEVRSRELRIDPLLRARLRTAVFRHSDAAVRVGAELQSRNRRGRTIDVVPGTAAILFIDWCPICAGSVGEDDVEAFAPRFDPAAAAGESCSELGFFGAVSRPDVHRSLNDDRPDRHSVNVRPVRSPGADDQLSKYERSCRDPLLPG